MNEFTNTSPVIDPVEEYSAEITKSVPPLAAGEADTLTAQMLEGSEAAKQRLIEGHLPMVIDIAKRYAGRGISVLDLIEEGNLALVKAAETYSLNYGRSFTHYASDAIRRSCVNVIANSCVDRRIPVAYIEKLNKINRAYKELEDSYGRVPTVGEVAFHMGLPVEEIEKGFSIVTQPAPEPKPYNYSAHPDISADQKAQLEEVLELISPRERKILELRFGLLDGRTHTLEEVAAELGLTRERVRQIENKALRRMSPKLKRRKKLSDFLND